MTHKVERDVLKAFQADPDALVNALQALVTHARRAARIEHPAGSSDRGGRWYPSDDEDCGVTRTARSPSRAWPHSYNQACRSLAHCEALYDADHQLTLLLRRYYRIARLEPKTFGHREEAFEALKVVLAAVEADRRAAAGAGASRQKPKPKRSVRAEENAREVKHPEAQP
ncbi:hypothetical protein KPL74_11040 [Bacillus sp. NP157]|nr:hypothetical protein KPL74_11040 [Bacillus sp. NP157]